MHLSYQEVPLNGIILLTGDALSPRRDLQSAAKKEGGIERLRVGILQPREPGQITRDICSRLRDVSDNQPNGAGEPSHTPLLWHGTHNRRANLRLNELLVILKQLWLFFFADSIRQQPCFVCCSVIGLLTVWCFCCYVAPLCNFNRTVAEYACYCMLSATVLMLLSRPGVLWRKHSLMPAGCIKAYKQIGRKNHYMHTMNYRWWRNLMCLINKLKCG